MKSAHILTDETPVIAREDLGDSELDTSVSEEEVLGKDNRGGDVARSEDDKAVVVRDLSGLAREVPERKSSC